MGYSGSSSGDESKDRKTRKSRKAKRKKKSSKEKSRGKRPGSKTKEQDDLLAQLDEEDVGRRLLSLLQQSPQIEAELLEVFKQLDSWGIVYLQDLGDIKLRKKLRHLFRALLVGEVEGERGKGWRKPPTFNSSLTKLVKRRCKELRPLVDTSSTSHEKEPLELAPASSEQVGKGSSVFDAHEAERKAEEAVVRWRAEQASLQSPAPTSSSSPHETGGASGHGPFPAAGAPVREEWMLEAPTYLRCLAAKDGADAKRRKILQQKKADDEEAVRVKAVMDEWNKSRKLKSLRELREEGELLEGEEAYKRWKRSVDASRSVWGKRAAEQATTQEFKDDAKRGQPWQRFDRDRDLQTTPQVSQAEYQKLLQQTQLNSRFKSSWQNSFL